MWLDTQELSTLEYLYDLRWIRASSDKGSTATISESYGALPGTLTAAHDVFETGSLSIEFESSDRQRSFTIKVQLCSIAPELGHLFRRFAGHL